MLNRVPHNKLEFLHALPIFVTDTIELVAMARQLKY